MASQTYDLPVNELADFAIQNYNGSNPKLQADAAADNTFHYKNKSLRFVYLNAARLLVLDESHALVKKLAETYRIALAQPALVN